ncbi:helix-turn-helix transcriptional regulator [Chitinophaga horti]|uniref:Helix-turn-helix transcriptional regulator n=1 Tax=Chitinophaga horti TaxID=2920382 RepID=A0ABY6J4F7_9BACT|nr:helix-turn-helix transcriptional regulator [Chitinophaga horti]UYQ94512.1 helix-turn-helix transcriptional regulator [Chitinophaga horti]
MEKSDTPDRIVVNISWLLDTTEPVDLSKEDTGDSYCKHWRIDADMAVVYLRYKASRPLILRHNSTQSLSLIGFTGHQAAIYFTIAGKKTPLGQMTRYAAFFTNTLLDIALDAGQTLILLAAVMTPSYLQSLRVTGDQAPTLFALAPDQLDTIYYLERHLHNNSADFFYIKGIIQQLLAQSLPATQQPIRSTQKPEVQRLIQLVNDLLQDFTRPSPRIADAAASIGVSPSKFKAMFVKLYKQSYYSYLQHRKLERAREMLIHGEQSVADIAYSLGYSSGSHFTRLFRKKFKVSPQAFKNDPTPGGTQP